MYIRSLINTWLCWPATAFSGLRWSPPIPFRTGTHPDRAHMSRPRPISAWSGSQSVPAPMSVSENAVIPLKLRWLSGAILPPCLANLCFQQRALWKLHAWWYMKENDYFPSPSSHPVPRLPGHDEDIAPADIVAWTCHRRRMGSIKRLPLRLFARVRDRRQAGTDTGGYQIWALANSADRSYSWMRSTPDLSVFLRRWFLKNASKRSGQTRSWAKNSCGVADRNNFMGKRRTDPFQPWATNGRNHFQTLYRTLRKSDQQPFVAGTTERPSKPEQRILDVLKALNWSLRFGQRKGEFTPSSFQRYRHRFDAGIPSMKAWGPALSPIHWRYHGWWNSGCWTVSSYSLFDPLCRYPAHQPPRFRRSHAHAPIPALLGRELDGIR